MWRHWLSFLFFVFLIQTRTGVAPGTCGTWISDGTCPAQKRRPLLFIYWKWFSSQNLIGCRGSHRGSRTWPGERAQQRPIKMNYILMQTGRRSVKGQNLKCICERRWLYGCVLFLFLSFSQWWRPAEPDYYSALPPRSRRAAASTERRAHPWAVSCCVETLGSD